MEILIMAPAFQTTPFVGRNADGRLEIFVVGTDQALYDKWQTTVNGSWSDGWTNFGGSWLGDPAVGQNADGRFEIFGVGTDHALYHRWQTAPNNGWSGGWVSLGGSIFVGKPAVGRNADGRLEILVLGSNHVLYHNWQTAPNGGWSNVWYNEGGSWLGDPAVGQNTDGRLQIFVVGADHALYTKWQGTMTTKQVTTHSVESSHDILQPDSVPHGIITGVVPPPGWPLSGWDSFGGSFVGKPAVAQRADGRLQIFVVGTDHALYTKMQTAPNNVWFGGWADISLPPMDLLWDSSDDNGLPLNPRWRYQLVTGLDPNPPTLCFSVSEDSPLDPCTSQQTTVDSTFLCRHFSSHWRIPGHWNWFPVTLEGPISWHSHSAPGTDDDYNIKFFPQDNAGFTTSTAGQGFIELEFDSDETIDHFSTPWWQSFHDAVDNSDEAASQVLKDRSFAIVTGLFGLDCAHSVTDSNTELHPVYTMAIMVDDNPADQLWAIFVRNWGNEGYCATKPHPLDLQTYSFRLPWKEGKTTAPIISSHFLTNSTIVTGPEIQFALNEGVLVTFILPPPEAGAWVHGELHLQWQ